MNAANWILFAIAVYIAIYFLAKMMHQRAASLTKQFRDEFDREQKIITEKLAEQKRKERELEQQRMFDEMMAQRKDAA